MSRQRDPLPYVLTFIIILVALAMSARMYQDSLRELLRASAEAYDR